VDAQAHFTQLDPAIVVDPRLVNLEEILVIVFRCPVHGVRLTRSLVDSLRDDTRGAVVDFTSSNRIGKYTRVRAEHVTDAQDAAALVEVHEEAERKIPVLELVVPAAGPVRLNIAQHGERSLLRQAV